MIIDHIGLGVSDFARAKAFYAAVLAQLDVTLVMEVSPEQNNGVTAAGFGRNGKPDFWIGSDGKTTPPMHVAFTADSRRQVRAFYDAALAAGATDNGPPGLRPHYHANYYAAFVRDLDGHNIEAVCHRPE